jgi:hypothetical protein
MLPGTPFGPSTDPARHLDFIEVGAAAGSQPGPRPEPTTIAEVATDMAPDLAPPAGAPGWSLWGDPEA